MTERGSLALAPPTTPRARPRVVVVTPDIVGPVKNGGIGTACFHYARSLARAGYDVEVLFSGTVGEPARQQWASWYDTFGIAFRTLDDVPASNLKAYATRWHTERAQRIFDYLRNRPSDYILFQDWHANGFWAARAKQMGAAFSDVAIGLIAHSPNQWQKEGMRTFGRQPVEDSALEWAEKETIAAVDVLVSPSQHMIDWLVDHGYRLPRRVAICPYTFEDEVHSGAPSEVDRDHLIFFGRLETRKGLHLLADALRELREQGAWLPRTISFLGKPAEVTGVPTLDYLAQLEAELRCVEFVIQTDFDYREAVAYIKAANGVVVIPSILDNYPLTVIESITNGFCFIASDAGGIPEMIDPAVRFERTVDGLRRKLAELSTIDFSGLTHPYDPVRARERWLDHVHSVVAEPRALPGPRPAFSSEPVSVCVAFYRHDHYIERMVHAFLRMNLPDLQLVIVNDGTPLEERTRFERLRRDLEPLGHIFCDQPNGGPGKARNRAVELASHDRLLFFDADNVPFPQMVERLSRAMSATSADSIAAPFVGVPPMRRMPIGSDAVMEYRPPGGPLALALLDNVLGDVCAMVRRQAVIDLGGFSCERRSWEDWEFFLRALGRGLRHFVYPDPLFFYTLDMQGRNLTADSHENRRSLLQSFRTLPPDVTGQVAEIFATEFIVATGR